MEQAVAGYLKKMNIPVWVKEVEEFANSHSVNGQLPDSYRMKKLAPIIPGLEDRFVGLQINKASTIHGN